MYMPFLSFRDFISEILTNIDMQRKILRYAQHQDVPDIKAQVLKTMLQNLHYILPSNCCQVNSEVVLNFTHLKPFLFGQINDFYFLLINVTSSTCKPVVICLYINGNGAPVFTVPLLGNVFNPVTQKPYGMDVSDEEVCRQMTGKSVSEAKPDVEQLIDSIKDMFKLPEHSPFVKHDLEMNVSGIFQFTNKVKKI